MFNVTVNKEFHELHRDMVNAPHLIVQQMRFAASDAGRYMVKCVQSQIEGGGFADNAAKYREFKSEMGFFTTPLKRTGIMQRTVTWRLETVTLNGVSASVGWRSGQRYPAKLGKYVDVASRKNAWPNKNARTVRDSDGAVDDVLDGKSVSYGALVNELGIYERIDNQQRSFYRNEDMSELKTIRPPRPFMDRALYAGADMVIDIFATAMMGAILGASMYSMQHSGTRALANLAAR